MNLQVDKGTVSMKKSLIIGILITILAIMLMLSLYFFMPNNKIITAYPGNITSLVIEGSEVNSSNPPVFEENQVLLPLDTIKKYIDPDILWDEKLKKVIITTEDKVVKMNTEELTAYVNDKPTQLTVTAAVKNNVVYMPMDFLKDFYNIDISFIKDNNIVVIDFRNKIKKIGEVLEADAEVRKDMSVKSPIFKRLKKGDTLWAFDEYEKWYKVRTEDGIVGYMQKRFLKITSYTSSVYSEEIGNPTDNIINGRLNVVWDPLYNKTMEAGGPVRIDGLDVVIPTWFELSGDKGAVTSNANLRYVENAKKQGYRVWALFRNEFGNINLTEKQVRARTSKVLNSSAAREEAIKKILLYAKLYKLDGINIDFENMYGKDKDMFSQFIREMAPLLKEQGLVLTVDVGVPGGSEYYSLCYDRKALAKAANYIMVMTYDQHWASCSESGSVAQYTWMEEKIKQTLKEIPSSKLLVGLPFYTRKWEEKIGTDGKIIGKPKSTVYAMEGAKEWIKTNNAQTHWDAESGQFYAEYKNAEYVYKLWLEDEKSINLKSSLVHKYNLAGAASWRKGFESSGVWEVLDSNLKKNFNYVEWAQNNKEGNGDGSAAF